MRQAFDIVGCDMWPNLVRLRLDRCHGLPEAEGRAYPTIYISGSKTCQWNRYLLTVPDWQEHVAELTIVICPPHSMRSKPSWTYIP